MRYSLVLATMAASAIATPYINVEVSEPGDLIDEASRQGNHHRGMRRHDRDDQRRNRRGRNWFSSLWGSDDDVEEENRRREREREDRRNRRNQNRNRRQGRGRGGRDENDEENDEEYHVETYSIGNIIDDLFGTDFECVIQGNSEQEERRNARECCRQVGGELYDQPGRCIFRDVFENPREEWRDCALETKGAYFADCYYREQREVDDSLSSRRRSQHDSRRDRDSDRDNDRDNDRDEHRDRDHDRDHDRDSRDRRDRSRSRSRSRNDRNNRQHIFDLDEDNERNGRNGRIQCQVNENDEEPNRQVVRECCNNNQVRGRLNKDDEQCEVRERRQLEEFLNCAEQNTGNENAGFCYRDGDY